MILKAQILQISSAYVNSQNTNTYLQCKQMYEL